MTSSRAAGKASAGACSTGCLLFLAILHGQNGLRVMIDDYIHARGWRTFAHTCNWVFLGFFLALGTLTIVSFPFAPGTHT